MSDNIDNRVVQMQFENEQFERGIKDSTKSLEKFKETLELKGAEKGMKNVQEAARNMNLEHIVHALDEISERFSTLGIVGKRVLENLADSAYRMGLAFVKSVSVDQISAGFNKYEDKTKSVQTIVNATGLSIEEVDNQLSKLAWFTDETSYNFVDMVSNIGKFTSMNIPLDKSVTAMEGIATWAAVSGQGVNEASRAMYNLSQAMGVGAVKLMDWKSIENANMATSEFKQTAIDTAMALGVLKKGAKTAKGTAVTYKNFSQTLSEGWFTSDVLMKTLAKYGEYADEVYKVAAEEGITAAEAMKRVSGETMKLGEKAFKAAQEAKTFSEAIDSVKDAVSTGWMNTFELIFGNYEEAKVLWTDLANALYDVFATGAEGRNELLQAWKDLGGREDLLQGIYDIFSSLYGILLAVKDAIKDVFPPVTVDNLLAISTRVKEFGANLKSVLYYCEGIKLVLKETEENAEEAEEKVEAVFGGKLKIGDTGKEVEDLQKALIKLGYLDQNGADGIFGPKTQKAVKDFQEAQGIVSNGIFNKKTFKALEKEGAYAGSSFTQALKKGSKGSDVKELQEKLIELGYLDKKGADGIFGPKTEEALKKYQEAQHMVANGIYDENTYNAMHPKLEKEAKSAEYAEESIMQYGQALTKVQHIAAGASSAIDILAQALGFVKNVGSYVIQLFQPLIDAFIDIAVAAGDSITSLDEWIKKNDIFGKWFKEAKKYLEPFGEIIQSISDYLMEHFGTEEKLVSTLQPVLSIITSIGKILGAIFRIAYKVGTFIWDAGTRIADTLSPIWETLKKIFGAGVRLFSAFANKFSLFGKSFENSDTFVGWLAKLDEVLPSVKEKIQSFCDTVLNFLGLSGDLDSINFDTVVENIVNSIKKFFGLNADASSIADGIDTNVATNSIKDKIIEIYTNIKNWIIGLFKKDGIGNENGGEFKLDGYKLSLAGIGVVVGIIARKLFQATNTIIKTGKNVNKILANIKGTISSFKLQKRAESFDVIATAILKFAGSIAILAASVYVISTLSWKQLAVGLTGLAVIIGMLIGAVFAFKAAAKDFKNIDGAMGAILMLSAAIGALSASVIVLAQLSWEELARGLAGVIVLLGACITAIVLLSRLKIDVKQVSGTIGLFISLSTALSMLSSSMLKLGTMKTGDLIKGFLGITALMTAIALFTKSVGGINASGKTVGMIFVIAVAIDLLIAGLLVLMYSMKLLKPKDIIKGVAGLSIIIFGIVGLMKLIEKIDPSPKAILSLLPIAIALDLLIAGFAAMLIIMKVAKPVDILKALAGMTILVLGTAALMKLIEHINPSIKAILALIPIAIALDLLVLGFGGLLAALKGSTAGDIFKAVVGLGIIIIGIASLMKLISKMKIRLGSILALVPVALALDIAIAGFVVLALTMKSIGITTLVKSIIALGVIISAIAITAKALERLTNGAKGLKAAFTLIPFVLGISLLAVTFSLFAKSLQDIDTNTFIKALIGFAAVIAALVITTKVLSKSNIGIKGAITFLIAAAGLVLVMAGFAIALNKVKDINSSKIMAFAKSISLMMGVVGIVGTIAGLAGGSAILGIVSIAAGIGLVLAAFSAILSIPGVADFLSGGAEKLGKIFGSFIGAMKASEFDAFNKGMVKMQSLSDVDQDKVDNAIAAAQALADFGAGLPGKDPVTKIVDFIFGSELKQFSGDMSAFAAGFNNFASEISKVNDYGELTDQVGYAISIAESIKTFAESFPEKSIEDKVIDAVFGSELRNFARDMGAFGYGFNSFATQVSQVKDPGGDLEEKVAYAIKIAESIKKFGEGLPEKSTEQKIIDAVFGSELRNFSRDMGSFGAGFNSFAIQMAKVENPSGDLEEKAGYAIKIAESIKKFGEGLPERSTEQKIIDAVFGSELNQFSKDMAGFGVGFNSFSKQMSLIDNPDGDLEEKAGYAIKIAESIKKFGEGLPEKSTEQKIIDAVFGSELNQFAASMIGFGSAFKSFAIQMGLVEDPGSDLEEKTKYAIRIADSIKTFSESIKSKTTGEQITDSIFGSEFSQFSGDMVTFGNAFNDYANELALVDEPSNDLEDKTNYAIKIADSILKFTDKIPVKTVGATIAESLFGSKIAQFSGDMVTFGNAFNDYANELALVDEPSNDLEDKTNFAIKIADSILKFTDKIPVKTVGETIAESLFGSKIAQFSGDMVTFGKSFNDYAAEIMLIDEPSDELTTRTDNAITIAGSIKKLADGLKDKKIGETITDAIFGSELAQFTGDMTTFASKFKTYVDSMGDIPEDITSVSNKSASAIAIANQISSLYSTLQSKSIGKTITDAIFGSDLAQFTGDMTTFASKFITYATTMAGLNVNTRKVKKRTDTAIEIAGLIAGLAEQISGMGIEEKKGFIESWFTGDTKTDTVIDMVGKLAKAMSDSHENFKGLSKGSIALDIETAIGCLNSVADFLESVSGKGITSTQYNLTVTALGQLGDNLGIFQQKIADIDTNRILGVLDSVSRFFAIFKTGEEDVAESSFKSVDVDSLTSMMTDMITAINTAIASNKDILQLSGVSIGDDIIAGLLITDLTALAEFITSITSKLDSYKSDFEEVGKNFDIGLFWGVLNYRHMPVAAAGYVARQMVEAMKTVFVMASPSKVTQQIGQFFTEGLALGTKSKIGDATNAADTVANAMLDTASGPLKTLSQLLAEDIDDTPVIAPIIDLTNARQQAATIGDLFGNARTGVELTNTLATRATLDAEGKTVINPKQVEMDGKYSYGSNLDQLKEVLKTMSPKEVVSELQGLSDKFGSFAEAATNLKMVLDSGVLVGEISSMIDLRMGRDVALRERGN